MPIELAVTIQEAAKSTDWPAVLWGGAAALTGSLVGGLFTMWAGKYQVVRSQEEADKAAISDINEKLIAIAQEARRLADHMTWALKQDRATATPLVIAPEAYRFTLAELYRASRSDKPAFADSLRMVERGEIKMLSDYSYAIDFARLAEGQPNLMSGAPKAPRKMPKYLVDAITDTIKAANSTAAAARNVHRTVLDVAMNKYGLVLSTLPVDGVEVVPTA